MKAIVPDMIPLSDEMKEYIKKSTDRVTKALATALPREPKSTNKQCPEDFVMVKRKDLEYLRNWFAVSAKMTAIGRLVIERVDEALGWKGQIDREESK